MPWAGINRMTSDVKSEQILDPFAENYAEARRKFIQHIPLSNSYPCEAKGPASESLFTDVGYLGAHDAQNLLVLISGTHGVEGYCGSASQISFLQDKLHLSLPPSTGVLFIHALNAYGFAWDRRVTQEGCDLNRNFIDFSKPVPENPGYVELADAIVPPDLTEESLLKARQAILEYEQLHGPEARQRAISSGQYTHPNGMFYGGIKPTSAHKILEQIAIDFDLANRKNVIVIDYHSGLGPYGYGELQCEAVTGQDGYERAKRIFGESVTSPEIGTSTAAALHGCQAEFWEQLLGDKHVYVCLEYGTYEVERVLAALRDDHWLFSYSPQDADSELGKKIRRNAKECSYPQADDWKEMIIKRSREVHLQAISAFECMTPN